MLIKVLNKRKMSETENLTEILKYIQESSYAILNYVRSDLTPVSRAMGSFSPDGDDLFFSTSKDSSKVLEIKKNKRVSFYFEHDNQSPEIWRSVLLIGDAEPVKVGTDDYEKAIDRLAAKSPRFKERVAKGDLGNAVIYKIITNEFQYTDRSKGNGPARKFVVK